MLRLASDLSLAEQLRLVLDEHAMDPEKVSRAFRAEVLNVRNRGPELSGNVNGTSAKPDMVDSTSRTGGYVNSAPTAAPGPISAHSGRFDNSNMDDSPSVRRFDRLEPIHMDPDREDGVLATLDPSTGFLKVDARLARTGVLIYGDADGNRWGELRTEDEVFSQESLDSFKGVVLTDDHPNEFVSTANVKDVQVGHVGTDVRRDGIFVRATITITDAVTIAKVQAGKTQLSNGYTAAVLPHEGITDGEAHAFRQTRILGNHTAIVDNGRCGPECRMLTDSGDAYSETGREDNTMQTRKHTIGGVEHDVPVAVADALDAQAKEAEDAKLLQEAEDKKATEDAKKNPFGDDDEEDEDKKGDAALQAKFDLLEADTKAYRDGEAARIDTRAKLIATAAHVDGDIKTSGATNADIMRDVVLSIRPEFKDKLGAHADSAGYLEACYDQALELHAARKDATSDLHTTLAQTVQAGAKTDLQALDDLWMDKFGTSTHRREPAQETK